MAALQFNLFIERDEVLEQFSGYTADERAAVSERLSRIMSAYYTQHSEERNFKCK